MAEKEFPCPSCGAELKWQPAAGLACPYCEYQGDAPADAGNITIQEYRLEDAARSAPRGWGTERRSMRCQTCTAVSEIGPEVAATQCPFCGATQLDEASDEDVIRPESVLPFAIEREDAVRMFRGWLGGLWFRPSSLKSAAQIQSIRGVYVPAWTFDADATSRWDAEAGHYYYVEETRTAVEDGKQVQKTQRVRKTRWEPASGVHRDHYDDWIVQASGGLDQKALKGLLPYELAKLRGYDAQFLSGFDAERYSIDLHSSWAVAQKEIGSAERSKCRSEVPGDTQRNLSVDTSFSDVMFKHTLLPVWIAAYRYNDQVYRYLVNGDTGKATGDAPISWVKVILFVIAVLVVIGGCLGVLTLTGAVGAQMR